MRVLGIIPARGGSKGVPKKNLRALNGRPLLEYTARCALEARRLERVVLSTEDPEIAEVGRRCGLEVPFRRPEELARDESPMLPVVQHALLHMEAVAGRFDAICLLQPTSPLRLPADVDACIELLERSGAESVVTVLPVPAELNPHWVYFVDEDSALRLSTGERDPIPRRQELPTAYRRAGSVYVSLRATVVEKKSLYGERTLGYTIPVTRSVNIDDEEDWAEAERLVRNLSNSGY